LNSARRKIPNRFICEFDVERMFKIKKSWPRYYLKDVPLFIFSLNY